MEASLPRGVRDIGPLQELTRRSIISVVEETFKRFGFYAIQTPAIETLGVLNAKDYGDDIKKEIFTFTGESSGLRFDFTVPLARYVSMNKDIALPFKRYQIGQVWRKEEPQHMRYREFTQMDADIIGGQEVESDAEVVAAAAQAIDNLSLEGCTILINSRPLLENILSHFGVPKENTIKAIRIIDKIKKIGKEEVAKQLSSLMPDQRKSTDLVEFLSETGGNEDKFNRIKGEIKDAQDEVQKISRLISLVGSYKTRLEITFDPSLARGLDYYTGMVWEFVLNQNDGKVPAIASGGRYDNLIGVYSGNNIPATGVSLGVDRIADILDHSDKSIFSVNRVYVAYLDIDDETYALGVANSLRAQGIYVDLNVTDRKLGKQLDYANTMGFANVIIIGKLEREQSKLKLKNLVSGKEDILSVDDAIKVLKGI